MQGTVKKWDDSRGFGFIAVPGGQDVFVHHTGILGKGRHTLHCGDGVEFDTRETERGPLAVNLLVVAPAA